MSSKIESTEKVSTRDAVICVCCLGFFPAMYLIGTTVKGLIG